MQNLAEQQLDNVSENQAPVPAAETAQPAAAAPAAKADAGADAVLDGLDDIDFLMDDIEDKIAPLAL